MITRYSQKSQRRRARTRARLGAAEKGAGRLTVFRSNKYIYAQLVGADGKTLGGARGKEAGEVGGKIADLAKKMKAGKVVFDRGQYKYHGRVKRLAEAARAGGLKF